jgi:secreted trypsin-like serine protease
VIKSVTRTVSMLVFVLLASCDSGDYHLPGDTDPGGLDSSMQAMARAVDGTLVNAASPASNILRTTQVVGGAEVPDLRYPWMAAIYFRDAASGQFFPGCGGSLIAARWIVTAAHCVVDSSTGQQLSLDDTRFLIGNRNLTASGGVFGSFSRIVVHPDYTADPLQSDIALLQLSAAVSFEPITLANLVHPVPQNGERAMAAGWGSTFQGGDISPLLRQVELPVVAHNACAPFYSNIPNISLNESSVLCAGGSQFQRRDACQGDSGGPLFVPRGSGFVLAGIVSAGLGCARPGVPGVYTRVAGFFDWITTFVSVPGVYDGSSEDSVVAVADTVRMLDANSRIAASVARGRTNIYRTTQVSQVTLESTRGDADLYVFSNAVFSAESMVCRAEGDTAVDQCSLANGGTFFIAVAGFENADYTLTVTDGSGEITHTEPATLAPDTPVSGTVPTNITNVYQARAGSRATLTTWSGNTDLYIFSSETFTADTLLCRSRLPGTQQDICDYPTATTVFIAVAGLSTSSYSLNISNTVATAAASGSPCVDADGDGWGWDGNGSCRVDARSQTSSPLPDASVVDAACIDPDGDGWGWNGVSSCQVDTTAANTVQNTLQDNCIDADGDGWGWNGSTSCIP